MTPTLVLPVLGPDGALRWHVRNGDAVATIVVDTGEVYRNAAAAEAGEAFEAIVGALTEWYRTDAEEYYGLNAVKVRSELSTP